MAEAIVEVFADDGFIVWGDNLDNPIDYQHFQVSRELAERLASPLLRQATALFDDGVNRYRAYRGSPGGATRRNRAECIVSVVQTPIGPPTDGAPPRYQRRAERGLRELAI